jgi:hypothetical protein
MDTVYRRKSDAAAQGLLSGDTDFEELNHLVGGKRPTLHFATTTVGAGLGRWGEVTGDCALHDMEQTARFLEGETFFCLVLCGDAIGTGPDWGFSTLMSDACGCLSPERAIQVAKFVCSRIAISENNKRAHVGKPPTDLPAIVKLAREEVLAPLIEAQRTDSRVEEVLKVHGISFPHASASALSPAPATSSSRKRKQRATTSPSTPATPKPMGMPNQPGAPSRKGRRPATPTPAALPSAAPASAPAPAQAAAPAAAPAPATGPIGGPRGMNAITARLLSDCYPGLPPAQQPCPWLGLFGSCKRAPPAGNCALCPNGLKPTPAELDAMRALCDSTLAARITG